jgi:hypothetical protein
VTGGEPHGEGAAERVPHQVALLDSQPVEELEEHFPIGGDRVLGGILRPFGIAEPGQVDVEHTMAARQGGHHGTPRVARAAEAVEEKQRLAPPRLLHVELPSAHLDEALGRKARSDLVVGPGRGPYVLDQGPEAAEGRGTNAFRNGIHGL